MNSRESTRTQTTTLEQSAPTIDDLIQQTMAVMPEDRPPTVREQLKYMSGYAAIRNAWTTEDINLARETANKQLGHMTDGKTYTDDHYRDILTTASLWGARLVNNEVCVFSNKKGQPAVFRQKEYWRRRMFELPGFENFSWAMGEASHSPSGKCARISASASWTYRGVKQSISLTKTDEQDGRITVKCWDTDTPDQLIGKAEARLFAKVYAICTGSLWAKEDAVDETAAEVVPAVSVEKTQGNLVE